jgi:ketosteroid isomerase-like protein
MTGRRSSTDAVALRGAYDALNRGEMPRALELVAHDIDWHDESVTYGEPRRGRESFEQYLRSWFESFEKFRIHPEHIFPHGGT